MISHHPERYCYSHKHFSISLLLWLYFSTFKLNKNFLGTLSLITIITFHSLLFSTTIFNSLSECFYTFPPLNCFDHFSHPSSLPLSLFLPFSLTPTQTHKIIILSFQIFFL